LTATKRILFIFSLVSLWIASSCGGSKKTENALTEGLIEYNAEVVDQSHPMAGLAPSSATVKFKNNKLQVEMSTMGIFNTTFISDPHKKTLTQMVKFMDIKNACIQGESDLELENKDYELKFEETKETKKIAGYACKKVKTTMVNNPAVVFDVYYTDELGMDSINNVGPYKAIKGMLMQYRLKKLGLEMCFTATVVKKEEIKDDVFEVPSFYKIVTRPEMEKLFEDIQK
jgi:GLPGLI family protein